MQILINRVMTSFPIYDASSGPHLELMKMLITPNTVIVLLETMYCCSERLLKGNRHIIFATWSLLAGRNHISNKRFAKMLNLVCPFTRKWNY